MKKVTECMKKNGHWLAAFLLFGVIVLAIAGVRDAKKISYRIVCLGDSIVGNEQGETSITGIMSRVLSQPVFNGAFGGTTMTCRESEKRADVTTDTLSLARLSQAIALQDFGVQNAGITRNAAMEYFPGRVYEFQDVDFDQVEILVIEHGVNDYQTGVPLDNDQDPYDIYTFGGALRYSIETLKKAYPDLRIILVTPTYCWFLYERLNCEQKNLGHGYLKDYVDLEKEIAAQYGLELVDNYYESGIGSTGKFEEWEFYTQDGLHLNEAGRELVANRIIACIQDGVR